MRSSLKQTTVVAASSLGFLVGLVLGRHALVPLWPALVVLATAFVARQTRLRPLLIVTVFLLFGVWRAGVTTHYDQTLERQFGQKITFSGVVADDPALSDTNQLSFTIADNSLNGQPYHASIG